MILIVIVTAKAMGMKLQIQIFYYFLKSLPFAILVGKFAQFHPFFVFEWGYFSSYAVVMEISAFFDMVSCFFLYFISSWHLSVSIPLSKPLTSSSIKPLFPIFLLFPLPWQYCKPRQQTLPDWGDVYHGLTGWWVMGDGWWGETPTITHLFCKYSIFESFWFLIYFLFRPWILFWIKKVSFCCNNTYCPRSTSNSIFFPSLPPNFIFIPSLTIFISLVIVSTPLTIPLLVVYLHIVYCEPLELCLPIPYPFRLSRLIGY